MKHILKHAWNHGPALLGVIASGGLLFLALRDVHFKEVVRTISQARIIWIIPMCAVILADLWIRALRWRLLLPQSPATVRQLLQLEAIGLAVNNVVFLRIGELVRAYLAAKKFNLPTLTSLATIMIERSLDMIALTLLFAATSYGRGDIIPETLGHTALLVALGLITALVVLSFSTRFLSSHAASRLKELSPKTHHLLEQGILGAKALRSWKTSIQVAALSLSLWFMDAGLYWTGAQAMRFDPHLDYGHSILVLSAAAAASVIPAVPGAFGTFEQAVKIFLVRLKFDPTLALSYAGFVHIVNYLLITVLGILFLYKAGHTLASLKAMRRSS